VGPSDPAVTLDDVSSAPGPAAADGPSAVAGPLDEAPAHDVRAVLRITAFRRLWLSLGLSSFGDWLGLLATTAMAASLGRESSYAAANLAVSGVLILRLAPAIVFGPLAGVLADRFDRKVTMVVGDILRAVLFVSIPVVGTLWWLFVATVLVEVVGLFWLPAKDATVPNLVPRERLEAANQLSLATTYGSAPLAALLFTGLALVSGALDNVLSVLGGTNDLALYVNALTYAVAAAVIWRLELPPGPAARREGVAPEPVWRTVLDGWRFIGTTPLVRGLVVGMLGAFGAGGFVIGVAPTFVRDLGAGEPGYGVLFAAVFTGLASGMWAGPRVLAELTRWRLFALAVIAAGVLLALLALIPNIVLATGFAGLLGAAAGVAWVTGYTLLGLEVADELRGRTFAFVQSAARVVLVAVMAFAPALAALIGTHRAEFSDTLSITYNGAALTLLVAAGLAIGIGVLSYRTMDDSRDLPLVDDVVRAFRRRHVAQPWQPGPRPRGAGFLVALEGGDGAGKSSQAAALERWLRDDLGHDVVRTREPGATPLGEGIRALLLHGDHVSPRAEALLFAADRAHHVETVLRPALQRGAVVVTDRYVDSSIAYQGAGRHLDADEVAHLSRWATQGLVPDLTVLLDIDPAAARTRRAGAPDRLEREAADFHAAVREGFLALARREPRRYAVIDASQSPDAVAEEVRARLASVLPPSPRAVAAAEAARAEQARAEQARAEQARAEQARAEQARAEQERADRERELATAERERELTRSRAADLQRAQAVRAEQARAEQARVEAARAEHARAEAAWADAARAEAARAEAARAEAARAEAARAEAAGVERARVEAARAERTQRLEEPRVEQQRVEHQQDVEHQRRVERHRVEQQRPAPAHGSWFDDVPRDEPELADELFGPSPGDPRGGVPDGRR
jgi:dTMP kinase